MSDRKLAPHVARAIGAAQAKVARQHEQPNAALHVAAALRPSENGALARQRGAAPALQAKPAPPRRPALHVAAAIGRPAPVSASQPGSASSLGSPLQAKPAALASPAPHLVAALSRTAGAGDAVQAKKSAAEQPPAAHVAAAIGKSAAPVATGRLHSLAAHLRAAQAKMAPERRPAAHLGAALAAVQPSKAAWEKRKKLITEQVSNVNKELRNTEGKTVFKLYSNLPSDVKVDFPNMKKSGPLNLSEQQSQMVNFTYGIKNVTEIGPELQTALISLNSKKRKLKISSNFSKKNESLRKLVGNQPIRQIYSDKVRGFSVERRAQRLKLHARKLKKGEVTKILKDTRKKMKKSDTSSTFHQAVNQEIAKLVHKKTRKDELRVRFKSMRKFSYSNEFGDLELEVAKNSKDYHAESAILDEGMSKPTEKIEMVIGTKVPCMACQAFFRGTKCANLLIDHTSFAWTSKSSLLQLGFQEGKVEEFLKHIHKSLGTLDLYQYSSSSGEFELKDLNVDEDPSSDSEDEDAKNLFDFQVVEKTKKGKPIKKDENIKQWVFDFSSKEFK